MIPLHPTPYAHFYCPACSHSATPHRTVFAGIRTVAQCVCGQCGFDFYIDYPIGHALHYPMAVGAHPPHATYNDIGKWWTNPLVNGIKNPNNAPLKIEKRVLKPTKNAVILNCIDYLYGHSLLKLFNAQAHLQSDTTDLILIIQRNFEWLIPAGCAEVWIIDLPLSAAQGWFTAIDDFVQNEIKRFDTVQLSIALSHPPDVEIQKFVGIEPFNINEFTETPPTITFIWRSDRLWHSNIMYIKIYELLSHFNLLKYIKNIFLWLQYRRYRRVFANLKKTMPHAQIYIVGLGVWGNFDKNIHDQRTIKITTETEKNWCEIYAKSHLVVGIHGSNMILPTALSAGFIEILPKERHGNITQDIQLRHKAMISLFLCRFVDEFINPKNLSDLIKNMIDGFPLFYLHNAPQHTRHQAYTDATAWQKLRKKYMIWAKNLQKK